MVDPAVEAPQVVAAAVAVAAVTMAAWENTRSLMAMTTTAMDELTAMVAVLSMAR